MQLRCWHEMEYCEGIGALERSGVLGCRWVTSTKQEAGMKWDPQMTWDAGMVLRCWHETEHWDDTNVLG